MKPCHYCGRDNKEAALHCHECGSELQVASDREEVSSPTLRQSLRKPANIAWIAAVAVLVQAAIRLSMSPYNPVLGDGNVERLDAAVYNWASIGISIILVCLGFYLRSRGRQSCSQSNNSACREGERPREAHLK